MSARESKTRHSSVGTHKKEIVIALILTAAVLAVYGQVIGHGFVNIDDDVYVTENPHVRAGLTLEGVKWAFTTNLHGHWHPLAWLSHMTDAEVFGGEPAGHHLTSLMLHAAATLLCFFLLLRTTGALYRSAAAAALFALHPLHAETVSWVADRKDALCAVFFLLALGAYVRYTERPGAARYAWVLLCTALALLSKSIAVALPAVMLLLDIWPLRRFVPGSDPARSGLSRAVHLIGEKWGIAVLVLAAVLATFQAMKGLEMESKPLSEWWRADAFLNYLFYVRKFLWPTDLTVFYPYLTRVPLWKLAGSAALVGCITTLAVLWARKRPYFFVGWLWFIIMLLPVIGIIRSGPHKVTDRYMYLPLIGLIIAAVWGASELAGRFRRGRQAKAAGFVLVMAAAMTLSWRQAGYWEDSIRLLTHSISLHPRNWLALNNLGEAHAKRGAYETAVRRFREAVAANPRYAMTHYNLGNALARSGDSTGASAAYREAIRLRPDYVKAYHNLGVVLAGEGEYAGAVAALFEAVRLDPAFVPAHRHLGETLEAAGRPEEALRVYDELLRREARDAALHNRVGILLTRLGRADEALAHYETALRIRPDLAEAHNNLGVLLARRGSTAEALDHFREALRHDPQLAGAQRNLERARAQILEDP